MKALRRTSALWFLLAIVLLAAAAGRPDRSPVATSAGRARIQAPPPAPVYSIARIRPGMTLEEVERMHGTVLHCEPERYEVGSPAVAWMAVRQGKVRTVWGRWLFKDGQLVARPPLYDAQVKALLGEPLEVWDNNSFCAYGDTIEWDYEGGLTARFFYDWDNQFCETRRELGYFQVGEPLFDRAKSGWSVLRKERY